MPFLIPSLFTFARSHTQALLAVILYGNVFGESVPRMPFPIVPLG